MNKRIIEAQGGTGGQPIYFSMVQNYLLCSYSRSLLEHSIMESESPVLGRNEHFLAIYSETPEEGLCKFYLNYRYADDFARCYWAHPDPMVKNLSRSVRFSGLKMDVRDNYLDFEGFTNIDDSLDSYINAILLSGKGELTAHTILSDKTAIYHSLCFDNGVLFYKNLLKVMQSDEKRFKKFQGSMRSIEKLLDINLERDMLSWVGNEVAFARNAPDEFSEPGGDPIVVMKVSSRRLAEERLAFIAGQVEKKTPASFVKKDFGKHSIYYLEIPGFFGLFFGNAFSALNQPYFTIIGEHVVFANHPEILFNLISDYESGQVLTRVREFTAITDALGTEVSAFSYLATQKALPVLENKLNSSSKTALDKNRLYFNAFPAVGIQLTGRGEKFYTRARFNFGGLEEGSDIDPLKRAVEKALTDTVTNPEALKALDLVPPVSRIFYPETGTVRLECEMMNGVREGRCREFYENGALKASGFCHLGKKTGTWLFFNSDGTLQGKEQF